MFGKTNKLFVLYALVVLALMAPTFAAVIKRSTFGPQFGGLQPLPEDKAVKKFNNNVPVRTQRKSYDLRTGPLNMGSTAPKIDLDLLSPEAKEAYLKSMAAKQDIPQQPVPASAAVPAAESAFTPAPAPATRSWWSNWKMPWPRQPTGVSPWSNWKMPWPRQPVVPKPPSSAEDIGRLLENPPPAVPGGRSVEVNPTTYYNTWKVARLPGNGWDANVLHQLAKGNMPFFVKTQGDAVYQVSRTPTGAFQITRQSSETAQDLSGYFRKAIVKTPSFALTNGAYGAGSVASTAKSGSSWWGRLSDGASGFFGRTMKYLRPGV